MRNSIVRLIKGGQWHVKVALAIVVFCGATTYCGAVTNTFFAPASAGGNTGADCANARAASTYVSGDSGSDKTIIFCAGTYTSSNLPGSPSGHLVIGAGGTSGHPSGITLQSGANFSQANWGGTCIIDFSNRDWIVFDGGATGQIFANPNLSNTWVAGGLIENTNVNSTNNTGVDTDAICGQPTNNSIVKNMLVQNLFVKTVNNTTGGGDGIHLWGNNNRVTNSTVHDMKNGISIDYLNTQTGGEIDHNMCYASNWCDLSADRNSSSSSNGMLIHDNVFHDWANWDNLPENNFHHNGVFVEVNNATAFITNMQVYNNYGYGDTGTQMTGEIFMDAEGSGTNGSYNGAQIFNNLLTDDSTVFTHSPSNGFIVTKANGGNPTTGIYNNTFNYLAGNTGYAIRNQGAVLSVENNICTQCQLFLNNSSGTVTVTDYNDSYLGGGNSGATEGPHSITSNPLLTATYKLNSGSPAISAALNLTSLGITNLNLDAALVSRPPSLPWDMGWLQFATSFLPAPPFPCNACMASLKNPFGGNR